MTNLSQQPVDRARRYKLITRLTIFCLGTAGAFTVASGLGVLAATALVEIYVRALLSLAMASVMAYVGGSVIDYNGGVGNIISSQLPRKPQTEEDESL